MAYDYETEATPQEMRVIKAVYVEEAGDRAGTGDSNINVLYFRIPRVQPDKWDEHWQKMAPYNKDQRIRLARKILAVVNAPAASANKFTGTHKFGFGPRCLLCGVSRHDVEDWVVPKDCPALTDENRDLDPFVIEGQLK